MNFDIPQASFTFNKRNLWNSVSCMLGNSAWIENAMESIENNNNNQMATTERSRKYDWNSLKANNRKQTATFNKGLTRDRLQYCGETKANYWNCCVFFWWWKLFKYSKKKLLLFHSHWKMTYGFKPNGKCCAIATISLLMHSGISLIYCSNLFFLSSLWNSFAMIEWLLHKMRTKLSFESLKLELRFRVLRYVFSISSNRLLC